MEKLVADSLAINLPLEVAAQMERKRSFADLEPERAWLQWQIARRWNE